MHCYDDVVMPKFTHKLETEYKQSFRSACIEGMFDVPIEKKLSKSWEVNIPIEDEEWAIGLIVGPNPSKKKPKI